MKTGLYLHIPFCARKCPYCDFYSCGGNRDIQHRYIDRVLEEMSDAPIVEADSLYLGGGTPSLLLPEELARVTAACRERFALEGEVTLEANPGTVTPQALFKLRDAGFNRISFGVQSFVSEELQYLGRLHSAKQAADAVLAAKAAGFDEISVDLMLGIPGQTKEGLEQSLAVLQTLPVTHLSAYLLKIEPGTPFDDPAIISLLPDEETTCALYLRTVEAAASMGLLQYEISNFARPGSESRHNLKYWQREPYLAFGPSAHGFLNGVRYTHKSDLNAYLAGDFGILCEDDHPNELEETLMLGLRLTKGLSFDALASRFSLDCADIDRLLRQLIQAGLMQPSAEGFGLTPQGFLVSNSILVEWLSLLLPEL